MSWRRGRGESKRSVPPPPVPARFSWSSFGVWLIARKSDEESNTTQERLLGAAILVFWAILFLPNLRTNPNWYGDEAIVLEEAWTLSQGHPRYGAMREDFLSPNPHPPHYLLALGGMLQIFGNDILTGRILQVMVALVTTAILFWVGTRLRDKNFGFLCAAAFLCYPEVVIHYRWVRGHPMMGMWALASVGFLIQYVQEKRSRDIALAGLMASLAVGSHYFAFPLMGAVILTALLVHKRHVWVAIETSGAFAALFFFWFILSQPGGRSICWFVSRGRPIKVLGRCSHPGPRKERACTGFWWNLSSSPRH